MKIVNVNVDQAQVFVIINNVGIMINADVNVKNCLTKEYVIKNLFGILAIVNVNVINVEKFQLTNQLKNIVKILMKIKYI